MANKWLEYLLESSKRHMTRMYHLTRFIQPLQRYKLFRTGNPNMIRRLCRVDGRHIEKTIRISRVKKMATKVINISDQLSGFNRATWSAREILAHFSKFVDIT